MAYHVQHSRAQHAHSRLVSKKGSTFPHRVIRGYARIHERSLLHERAQEVFSTVSAGVLIVFPAISCTDFFSLFTKYMLRITRAAPIRKGIVMGSPATRMTEITTPNTGFVSKTMLAFVPSMPFKPRL